MGALYNLGVKISGMLCKELDEENQQNTYLKFNGSPLKSYLAPKGKDRLPNINFQGFSLAIKLRGCTLLKKRGGGSKKFSFMRHEFLQFQELLLLENSEVE